MKLFNWQIPAFNQINAALSKYGSALNASDTGTGKTVMTLATLRKFGWRLAVVAPKSTLYGWRNTAQKMGVPTFWAHSYEKLIRADGIEGLRKTTTVSATCKTSHFFKWSLPDDVMLVFDEVHRCKNYATQNSQALIAAAAQDYATIMLSATVADSPLHLKAVGINLGLFRSSTYMPWCMQHGVTKGYWGGYEFHPATAEAMFPIIHGQIFPERGARIKREDVPGFPPTQICAECFDLSGRKQTEETNQRVEQIIEMANNALTDGKPAMEFRLRMFQMTEVQKVGLLAELVEEHLENGFSVCVFMNFRENLASLKKMIQIECAEIHGGQTGPEREKQIQKFQSNKVRVILVQIQAGGTGIELDDKLGGHPRASLICPTDSAVALKQVLGRVQRTDTKTKSIQRIIFAAGTVEEEICENVKNKLDRLDLLNDGVMFGGIFN